MNGFGPRCGYIPRRGNRRVRFADDRSRCVPTAPPAKRSTDAPDTRCVGLRNRCFGHWRFGIRKGDRRDGQSVDGSVARGLSALHASVAVHPVDLWSLSKLRRLQGHHRRGTVPRSCETPPSRGRPNVSDSSATKNRKGGAKRCCLPATFGAQLAVPRPPRRWPHLQPSDQVSPWATPEPSHS